MNRNRRVVCLIALAMLALTPAGAQVLNADQLKKVVPVSYFYAAQNATVQARNAAGFKNQAGKFTLAGLVDTSGYSTAIAEKYQGFFITEAKLTFDGATLETGAYGFGFKDGKFIVTNIAGGDVFSVACQKDDQLNRPVPLKFVSDGGGYRLYAGRQYVVMKAD